MWLKRSTPQNIVIGGAAGALPPVVGYAAATGSVTLDSLTLFAIIFIWTPPHFWALALVKSGDYARAGVPMMPNVKGRDPHAAGDPALYLVLVPLGVTPWLIGVGGALYGAAAVVARRGAWRSWRRGCSGPRRRARRTRRRCNFRLFDCLSVPALLGLDPRAWFRAHRTRSVCEAHEMTKTLRRNCPDASPIAQSSSAQHRDRAGRRTAGGVVLCDHDRQARAGRLAAGAMSAMDMNGAETSAGLTASRNQTHRGCAALTVVAWSARPMQRCRSILVLPRDGFRRHDAGRQRRRRRSRASVF